MPNFFVNRLALGMPNSNLNKPNSKNAEGTLTGLERLDGVLGRPFSRFKKCTQFFLAWQHSSELYFVCIKSYLLNFQNCLLKHYLKLPLLVSGIFILYPLLTGCRENAPKCRVAGGFRLVYLEATLIEKGNKIFIIYKEIQSGAVAKSYMRKGLLKGAQAWDIRDRVNYTEPSHLGRWLED